MHELLLILTLFNMAFFVIHELDAIKNEEWKMFKFLRSFSERNQKLIFIYAHLPLPTLILLYFYCVFVKINFIIFLAINLFAIFHLLLHLAALKWKSNVFKSTVSFISIFGFAVTALINLIIAPEIFLI